ncbi:hypothetical protein THIOM_000584, partial [Candidatus Thiomargarita nelsonii]
SAACKVLHALTRLLAQTVGHNAVPKVPAKVVPGVLPWRGGKKSGCSVTQDANIFWTGNSKG